MTLVQADVGSANNKQLHPPDGGSHVAGLRARDQALGVDVRRPVPPGGHPDLPGRRNFIKFNAISDATNTRINRMEIRSRTGGTTADGPNLDVPTGVTGIWLRLTKSGTSYQAEASFNGTTWQNVGAPVTNVDAGHEVRPLHGRRGRRGRHGDLRLLQGQRVDRLRRRDQHGAGDHLGDGDARRRASRRWRSTLQRRGDGRQRRCAHVLVGLRRQRLRGRDGRDGVDDVHHRRQPHGEADGVRRQGRHRHAGHPGPGARRRRPGEEAAGARVLQDRRASGTTRSRRASRRSRGSATSKNWQVDATEDASLFTDAVLSHYDVVIFLSTTGDVLNAAQQTAFENFIKSGQGLRGHPRGRPTPSTTGAGTATWWARTSATTRPERRPRRSSWRTPRTRPRPVSRPAGAGLTSGTTTRRRATASGDDYSPRSTAGVHVLLTMDESTYAEDDGSDGTDDDHPISWCQRYDGGRSWYTGMGHTQASFQEAGFLSHIGAGIEIAAGVLPSAACGVAPQEPGDGTEVPGRGRRARVPGTLSLALGRPCPRWGSFQPGVTARLHGHAGRHGDSSATASALTVRDPSATATRAGWSTAAGAGAAAAVEGRERCVRCAERHRARADRVLHPGGCAAGARSTSSSPSRRPSRCSPAATRRPWSSRCRPRLRKESRWEAPACTGRRLLSAAV